MKKEKNVENWVVVRSNLAGCFLGLLMAEENIGSAKAVTLDQCRRLWRWSGAASLSQLALDGVAEAARCECKFPPETNGHRIFGVDEIIPATQKSVVSIKAVPPWKF